MFYLIADEEDLAKEMPGTSHDEVLRLLEEMNKMENGVSTSDKKNWEYPCCWNSSRSEDLFDQSDKSENKNNDAVEEDVIDINTATHYVKALR